MKVLFYFGHPSQYLFLRNTINYLREEKTECDILIKSKDVLEKLLIENKESYINILPEGRKSNKSGIITGLIKRDFRLLNYMKNKHYDLFIGTDPALAHVGFLKKIPVITVLEDDIKVIPDLARITFPFTSLILTPDVCRTGKYEKKTIHYCGYMKLAYLHPNWFIKSGSILKQPYFLIRISKLDAYHDMGIKGFTLPTIKGILKRLERKGEVYISSEKELDESLKTYELNINPTGIHQALANSTMLISDSQSMTMEAAMLGVPSIRFSDLAGKISVLEELEHKYGLTFGIPANNPVLLFEKLNELLSISDLNKQFEIRRQKMLGEKIDVTAFLIWFIENYPKSKYVMHKDPDYQTRFK